jgi:hypothetical protein
MSTSFQSNGFVILPDNHVRVNFVLYHAISVPLVIKLLLLLHPTNAVKVVLPCGPRYLSAIKDAADIEVDGGGGSSASAAPHSNTCKTSGRGRLAHLSTAWDSSGRVAHRD